MAEPGQLGPALEVAPRHLGRHQARHHVGRVPGPNLPGLDGGPEREVNVALRHAAEAGLGEVSLGLLRALAGEVAYPDDHA